MTTPGLADNYRTGWSVGVTAAYPSHSCMSGVAEVSYRHHPRNLDAVRANPFTDPALNVGGGGLSVMSVSSGIRGIIQIVGPLSGHGTLSVGVYRGVAERLTFTGPGAGRIDSVGSKWWHPGTQVEGGLQIDLFPGGRIYLASAFTRMFSESDAPYYDGHSFISLRGGVSFGI